jgi:hypothetical protein
MKRQSDRQDDPDRRLPDRQSGLRGDHGERVREEIEILEDKKNQAGRRDADPEQPLLPRASAVLDPHAGKVIDQDGREEDQDVRRNERHVEPAARNKQQRRLQAFLGTRK